MYFDKLGSYDEVIVNTFVVNCRGKVKVSVADIVVTVFQKMELNKAKLCFMTQHLNKTP